MSGDPLFVGDVPLLAEVMRAILPLALGLSGALLLGARIFMRFRKLGWLAAFALLAIVAHVAFKQVFAITYLPDFIQLGLAERTVWQALLATLALGFAIAPQKLAGLAKVAPVLAATALGHFALFGLILHNPLWAEQAVGGWPIANLLLLSYGISIGLIVWLRGQLNGNLLRLRPVMDASIMVLVALLCLSELRQIFTGTLLTEPAVGAQEDLLRSLLAIVVALGFLGWGSWSKQRSWRIGSLILMLLAVLKVFMFDAAGLEGLARIVSFFALGVCLIGIGWFYSRQLVSKPQESKAA